MNSIEWCDVDNLAVVARTSNMPLPHSIQPLYDEVEEYVKQRINYYKFLMYLTSRRQPIVVLELGVEYGIASACMCMAASTYGGRVIGIDLNWHHIPGSIIPELCHNYTFIHGNSVESVDLVRKIATTYGPIGLVFQDSSHHYDASVAEWNAYAPMLDKRAIWVCDDILEAFIEPGVDRCSMVDYWRELPHERKLYDGLHTGNKIGVMLCP